MVSHAIVVVHSSVRWGHHRRWIESHPQLLCWAFSFEAVEIMWLLEWQRKGENGGKGRIDVGRVQCDFMQNTHGKDLHYLIIVNTHGMPTD
jgi:hypothetical protein